jgi:hypothetical protein
MNEYRYILDKSSKKFICPVCNKKKLVRFIDTETDEYLSGDFGRCDDEHYFSAPKEETKGYFVPIESISELNEKCVIIKQDNKEHLVPKAVVLDTINTGVYIAAYFINDTKNKRKQPLEFKHVPTDSKYFSNGVAVYTSKKTIVPTLPKIVHFDFETFKNTLTVESYSENIFLNNLLEKIRVEDVTRAVELYRLGTISEGYMKGGLTIPFIDKNNNIRAVQVKTFNKDNHTQKTSFLHSIIENNSKEVPKWITDYKEQDKKITCFFGEHLLNKYPNNPIGLVEAPKTAIICSLYFGLPKNETDTVFLAVYNKSSFSEDKVKSLQGRKVVVFPDLSLDRSTFNEWKDKAIKYSNLFNIRFVFSDLIEKIATIEDKQSGLDIADFLLKFDYNDFNSKEDTNTKESKEIPLKEIKNDSYSIEDVKELERFFNSHKYAGSIEFDFGKIEDTSKFIDSHLNVIRGNINNKLFNVYFDRLKQLQGKILSLR